MNGGIRPPRNDPGGTRGLAFERVQADVKANDVQETVEIGVDLHRVVAAPVTIHRQRASPDELPGLNVEGIPSQLARHPHVSSHDQPMAAGRGQEQAPPAGRAERGRPLEGTHIGF